MACRVFGNKPYLNQLWAIVNLKLRNKVEWNFDQNHKFLIHENVSGNVVCVMAAILSRGNELRALYMHSFSKEDITQLQTNVLVV